MNNKDEYIMEDNGFILTFLKNGLKHREAGPALFWRANKDKIKLLSLGDESLYEHKHIELESDRIDFYRRSEEMVNLDTVYYYLEDKSYEKDKFDLRIKEKEAEELFQELNKNQPEIQAQVKKPKL
jgi:hypothetical protein